MSNVEKITAGSAEMEWDADSRLATLRFTSEANPGREEAIILVNALANWIGTEPDAFGLLGDGGKLSAVDADYRSAWGAFFRERRAQAFVAFFNMKPIVRIAAEMFRIGTGVQLKAYADEADARSWLRDKGISA